MDSTDYEPSDEEMEETPTKKSKPSKATQKKKEAEFEAKKNVAVEVEKYKNLYQIEHPKYYDKTLETSCWKKVAKSAGFDRATCEKHWESLKRSARYHSRDTKMPYKSGASADDDAVQKKYKDDWAFADVMAFYTPPSLKKQEKLVSVYNRASTSGTGDKNNSMETSGTLETSKTSNPDNLAMDESSMSTVFSETTESVADSVYVSVSTTIFSF